MATSQKVGRPGRPRLYGEQDAIVGIGPHGALAWADGVWAGRPDRLVAEAEALVEAGTPLPVVGHWGTLIGAATDDPVAAAAVIAAVTGSSEDLVGAPVLDVS